MSDAIVTGTEIDLSKRNVQAFEFDALIQQGAMRRLAALLKKRVDDVAKLTEKADSGEVGDDGAPLFLDRRHGTILIHGGRGSGKTTFIRNAFHLIRKGGKPFEDLRNSISILGVVDPTLVENKENIFIIVVNKLRQTVEKMRKEKGDQGAGGGGSYKDWKESLKEMAQGLTLLDGIGPERMMDDGWDDAHYVTAKGLEKAQAGARLEQNFHDFVRKSLTFIGKKTFVLALDDIDTDFQRGWPVLEVLRRYLTSPHFIVIMSGDMDLYSMLVRGRTWANFDERHLRYDCEQKRSVSGMVGHLQSQYLLKLLPPENRIALQPLNQLDRSRIMVRERQSDPKIGLDDYLRVVVRDGLGLRGSMEDDIVALFLRQPLRTVIQLMMLHSDRDEEHGIARQLAPVFTEVMLRYSLSPDELQEASGAQFLVRLVRFLTENKLWSTGHALRPDHQSDELNQTLLVLAVQLNSIIKANPHLAIAYMIQIALAREVLVARLPALAQSPEEFIRYIEADRHRTLTGMAGRLVAVIGAAETASGLRLGVIQTRKRGGRRSQDILRHMYGVLPSVHVPNFAHGHLTTFYEKVASVLSLNKVESPSALGNYYNTAESLIPRLPSRLMRDLASLPVCRVLTQFGTRPTFFSAYRLLGVVGRLLEREIQCDASAVLSLISTEGLIRDYPIPPWLAGERLGLAPGGEGAEDVDPDEGENEGMEDARAVSAREPAVVEAFRTWLSADALADPTLPPAILARVMSRFFYALAAIDDAIEARDRFLGHLLHRQIIAFLNALLVEEALYRSASTAVDLHNAITKDDVFENNLRQFCGSLIHESTSLSLAQYFVSQGKRVFDSVPLFRRVFSCPLWGAYLNPKSFVFKVHMSVAGLAAEGEGEWIARVDYMIVNAQETTSFDNFYDVFNSVSVLGVNVSSGQPSRKSAAKAS